MSRLRVWEYDLMYPNDEDLPDEWEPHLVDGALRETPRSEYRDDTLDAVIERESLREGIELLKRARRSGVKE